MYLVVHSIQKECLNYSSNHDLVIGNGLKNWPDSNQFTYIHENGRNTVYYIIS